MGCGCVGIARLEVSLQEAASGNVEEARTLWDRGLKEIRERGYPDELRYRLREVKRWGLAPSTAVAGRR